MTRGMSLGAWEKIGMLSREIKPYQKLAEIFGNIYIFTYGDAIEEEYASLFPGNVEIVTRPKFIPSTLYSLLLPFIHASKLKNIQILKTNQMDGSWAAAMARNLYGGRLAVRCGYEWLDTLEKAGKSPLKRAFAFLVEKYAYRHADKIILTSFASRHFVVKRFGIDPNRIEIIPNYIDTDLFKPINIEKEENRIIFIGRLSKEKNLISFFQALEGLNAKIVLIGNGTQKVELEELAKAKKLNVVFLGNLPQSELPLELSKSQIFMLPSIYEGNPKALLEAMSCGLACIGTRVAGIESVIADNSNGILCGVDSDSIRTALKKLLGNKELCDKLGASARKSIENNNSFQVCMTRELAIYNLL